MFFRCKRRGFLLKWLFVLLGFRFATREHLTEEERSKYKTKAKTFRRKLREAFAVWDDEEKPEQKIDEKE